MEVLFALGAVPLIIVGIIVLAVIALIYAKVVYRSAGADEALIITGKRSRKVKNADGTETVESGIKVVLGAGVLVRPFFEKVAKLSLSSRAIDINVNAQDSRGVTIDVEAVALVKVGETDASIRAAAQRFLGQEKKIDDFAREVLSGSLRASIGATDVSTIIRKRDQLTVAVLDVAKDALHSQGLDVDSFEIKGISDRNEYISDLGRAERARVRLEAENAEAQADREAREARATADQAIAEAENTLAIRRAALQLDADRASAEAAAAGPLAQARASQGVVEQEQITAQKRAELRRAELESEVSAVAEAQARKTRVEAEAAAGAQVETARAQAEARRISAEAVAAEAKAEADARKLAADASRAEGEAAADAIRAKGQAEADATKAQADALAQHSEAVLRVKAIETLPSIARELAAPMSNIDTLTVVSSDGAGALSKSVVSQFSEVDALLGATAGFTLSDIVKSSTTGQAAARAVVREQSVPQVEPAE
jgi:flotillin